MKNLILITGVLICFYSCQKEEKPEETKYLISEYLPLSVGNYWIYQIRNFDISGKEYQTSTFDSTIISKDTIINGKKYFRYDYFEYNSINAYPIDTIYCRDSLKNLITSTGQILFSENNFTDTLLRKTQILEGDTIYTMTCKMEKINEEFSVPIGIYNNLLNLKGTVICSPEYTSIENPRYTNKYYAKEIGVIFQSQIYIGSGGFREKKLIRYNINK